MLCFYILLAVQIVVESLPISSSSHVYLLQSSTDCAPLTSTMLYSLHIPTAVLLAVFFVRQWFFILTHLRACAPILLKLIVLGIIADGMTALIFLLLHMMPITLPLGVGLCVTAAALYFLRFCGARNQSFGYAQAAMLGIAQGIALLPGISRFAIVYATARWLGINHRRAFEITWLIELPLIIAASAVSIYFDRAHQLQLLLRDPIALSVIVIASIMAYAALYIMERMAARNQLWILSFYMVIPLVLWWYLSW